MKQRAEGQTRVEEHTLTVYISLVSDELFVDVGCVLCCLMWCVMEFPVIWRVARPQRHVRMETAGFEAESWPRGLRFNRCCFFKQL